MNYFHYGNNCFLILVGPATLTMPVKTLNHTPIKRVVIIQTYFKSVKVVALEHINDSESWELTMTNPMINLLYKLITLIIMTDMGLYVNTMLTTTPMHFKALVMLYYLFKSLHTI